MRPGGVQAQRALLPTILLALAVLAAAVSAHGTSEDGSSGMPPHRRHLQAAPTTLPACLQQLAALSGKFNTCSTQKNSCTNQLAAARADASKAAANATTLATLLKAEKVNSSRLGRDLNQCKVNITAADGQFRLAKLNHTQCEAELQTFKDFAAGNASLAASRLVVIQRIASLEAQLNSTRAQLNSTQAGLGDARTDLEATIEDMKLLQSDLDYARQQEEDTTDAWYAFNATVLAEIRKNLTSCTNERNALAFNASSCAASLDIAQAGCEGMIEQLQAAQDANATCAGALLVCQSNVADLTWQSAGCDNRIAAVAAERDGYKAALDATRDSLANCTTGSVGLSNDLITLRAKYQEQSCVLTDCQDQLSQKEQDYYDLLMSCTG
ncbi:hypothetical protein ABPG75_000691 [Micractinium tetrahymenae]